MDGHCRELTTARSEQDDENDWNWKVLKSGDEHPAWMIQARKIYILFQNARRKIQFILLK